MTQIRLPRKDNCVTTICDSQQGDKLLLNKSDSSLTSVLQKSTQDRADVIILVYDLDRFETFYRLETQWLPRANVVAMCSCLF